MTKYCKDCKYYSLHFCRNPKFESKPREINLISGTEEIYPRHIITVRHDKKYCGPEAKGFEPKSSGLFDRFLKFFGMSREV